MNQGQTQHLFKFLLQPLRIMSARKRYYKRLMLAALLSLTVTVFGCNSSNGSGKGPYPLSGQATYQGKPIEIGLIHFEPDAANGATGPTLTAEIINGKYSSPQGKGTMGGAQLVQIEAYEISSSAVVDSPDSKKPMFPAYRTTATLPYQQAIQDFDVPAIEKKKIIRK